MLAHLASDLHTEFYKGLYAKMGAFHVHPQADVVVLPGDIGMGLASVTFANELVLKYGKPVILVLGNHESYRNDRSLLINAARHAAAPGVYVLENNVVEIEGVRFVGGTLWTDFKLYASSPRMADIHKAFAMGGMLNDFRLIRDNGEPFSPKMSAEVHQQTREFIDRVLDTPFDGKTVVVSHHAPHPESIHPKYAPGSRVLESSRKLPGENPNWPLNVCFASDLTPLVEKADFWFHGHVHDSFNFKVGKCRVVANPRGYPRYLESGAVVYENENYDKGLLINIG